jgi:ParB family chromosome partitioning protein
MIDIADIIIGARKRALDIEKVDALAASIDELGLLHPITVAPLMHWLPCSEPEQVGYRLVAGWHRLESAKKLGRTDIWATELEHESALELELVEIDENVVRAELSALELSEHLARRKEIYELLHPETRHGGDRKSEEIKKRDPLLDSPSFVDDTAKKTGMSPTVIRDAIRVVNRIDAGVRGEIAVMPEIADNKSVLAAIAKLSPSEQVAFVAAARQGGLKAVRKPVKLGGKRAAQIRYATDIIMSWVPTPDVERLIQALQKAGACSALTDALQSSLEYAARPFKRVVCTPRPGATGYYPNGNVWRPPTAEAAD